LSRAAALARRAQKRRRGVNPDSSITRRSPVEAWRWLAAPAADLKSGAPGRFSNAPSWRRRAADRELPAGCAHMRRAQSRYRPRSGWPATARRPADRRLDERLQNAQERGDRLPEWCRGIQSQRPLQHLERIERPDDLVHRRATAPELPISFAALQPRSSGASVSRAARTRRLRFPPSSQSGITSPCGGSLSP
jgi:hypothetical protein